jgi:hypothetical protein
MKRPRTYVTPEEAIKKMGDIDAIVNDKQFDLIILHGNQENGTFYLVPTDVITPEMSRAIMFADDCKTPDGYQLCYADTTVPILKGPKTFKEAEENNKLFDYACTLFEEEGEDEHGHVVKGQLEKYECHHSNISGYIHSVYTWANIM